MATVLGGNRNTNDIASVSQAITLNSTSAVTLANVRERRIYFQVNVLPGTSDKCVFIRLFAATDNADPIGDWIGRFNFGNDVFFKPSWRMPDNSIYTGEISGILLPLQADEDVYITEY